MLSCHEMRHIQYWMSWFVISKPKNQFISDCRKLNAQMPPPAYFRLPKLARYKYLYPLLQNSCKFLSWDGGAYGNKRFYLGPPPPRFRHVGNCAFEFQSTCFPLNHLPFVWTKVPCHLIFGQEDLSVFGRIFYGCIRSDGLVFKGSNGHSRISCRMEQRGR